MSKCDRMDKEVSAINGSVTLCMRCFTASLLGNKDSDLVDLVL